MEKIIPKEKIEIIPFIDCDLSIIKPLKRTRDWMHSNAYKCVPLNLGSELGYVIESPFDFWVEWLGGPEKHHINYTVYDNGSGRMNSLNLSSSFGNGIVTFYPSFIIKTPKDINILVKQPPNNPVHGLHWLEAMVETDNLLSTFSFNMRLTRPHERVYFKKGDPLAAFIPYPRFFADNFELSISEDEKAINEVQEAQRAFDNVRSRENGVKDTNGTHSTYRKGYNFTGCPFHNSHQTVLGYKAKQNTEKMEFFTEEYFKPLGRRRKKD